MSGSAPRSVEPMPGRSPLDLPETGRSGVGTFSEVLNLAEAAALVRCSRAHLSNIVNGKVPGIPHLPTVRIGRRVLFRRESLELWLQRVESATSARTQL